MTIYLIAFVAAAAGIGLGLLNDRLSKHIQGVNARLAALESKTKDLVAE